MGYSLEKLIHVAGRRCNKAVLISDCDTIFLKDHMIHIILLFKAACYLSSTGPWYQHLARSFQAKERSRFGTSAPRCMPRAHKDHLRKLAKPVKNTLALGFVGFCCLLCCQRDDLVLVGVQLFALDWTVVCTGLLFAQDCCFQEQDA